MRLIILLIAVVLVGLLVVRQLDSPDAEPVATQANGDKGPPRVPSKPGEVPEFEEDMNRYMDEAHEERRQRLERETRQ